jgi:uncharacterized Zn finger protein (UPF0148 family)
MKCPQCSREIKENELFCPNCGAKVLKEMDNEIKNVKFGDSVEERVEESNHKRIRKVNKQNKMSVVLSLTLPIFVAVFIGSALTIFYFHEQSINDEVLELKLKGEKLALEEDYDGAIEKLEEATEQRNYYKGIEIVLPRAMADKFNRQLTNVEN